MESPDGSHGESRPPSPYLCPGFHLAVSRPVHLARLHAGWTGCDRCEWRHDLEGFAGRARVELHRIREQRMNGIQRTEFGVRGVWLNDLDRRRAALLACIFCDAIYRERAEPLPDSQKITATGDLAAKTLSLPRIVAGYDSRPSSPDLFAGISSAVREFGSSLIDIGRCTAASLMEAARSIRGVQAAIIVTGSNRPPSYTGFDVLDPGGNPVAVPWTDYGVRLMVTNACDSDTANPAAPADTSGLRPGDNTGVPASLDLTPGTPATTIPRRTRQSGTCETVAFEDRYLHSLLRWFPKEAAAAVVVQTSDPLIQNRISWLTTQCQLNIRCHSPTEQRLPAGPAIHLGIPEDDRSFTLSPDGHTVVPSERLADRINKAIHSRASHVTAHADPVTGRFWLTDAARTSAANSTEHISDALITLGLLLRLISDRHLSPGSLS